MRDGSTEKPCRAALNPKNLLEPGDRSLTGGRPRVASNQKRVKTTKMSKQIK
jgi:hypothetical protein